MSKCSTHCSWSRKVTCQSRMQPFQKRLYLQLICSATVTPYLVCITLRVQVYYTHGYRWILQLFHLCSGHRGPSHLARQLFALPRTDAARVDARLVLQLSEVAELADRREVRTALRWVGRRVAGTLALRQTVRAEPDARPGSRQRPDERRDLRHARVTSFRTRRRRLRLRQEVRLDGGNEGRSTEVRLSDSGQSAGQRLRQRRATLGRWRWTRGQCGRVVITRRLACLSTASLCD